jgi:hypothetical protein
MTQAPSGYSERKRLEKELPGLTVPVRTALVAACAERVLPILEDYFEDAALFREAVALTWSFALGKSDEGAWERVVAAIEERAEVVYDDDEIGCRLYALNAVSYGLQSAVAADSDLAVRALSEAQGAADLDAGDLGDVYSQDEAEWQLAALDVALAAKAPTREMFAALPGEARWLLALRDRSA